MPTSHRPHSGRTGSRSRDGRLLRLSTTAALLPLSTSAMAQTWNASATSSVLLGAVVADAIAAWPLPLLVLLGPRPIRTREGVEGPVSGRPE